MCQQTADRGLEGGKNKVGNKLTCHCCQKTRYKSCDHCCLVTFLLTSHMASTADSARTVHVPVEALFYILDAIVDPSDDGL